MNRGYEWQDRSGRKQHVTELDDSHLINIIRYQMKAEESSGIYFDFRLSLEWFANISKMNRALLMEAYLRNLDHQLINLGDLSAWYKQELEYEYKNRLELISHQRRNPSVWRRLYEMKWIELAS